MKVEKWKKNKIVYSSSFNHWYTGAQHTITFRDSAYKQVGGGLEVKYTWGSPTKGQTTQDQTTQGQTTKGQTTLGQTTKGQKRDKG